LVFFVLTTLISLGEYYEFQHRSFDKTHDEREFTFLKDVERLLYGSVVVFATAVMIDF